MGEAEETATAAFNEKDFVIEDNVLVECVNKEITEVSIPENIHFIGEHAFAG